MVKRTKTASKVARLALMKKKKCRFCQDKVEDIDYKDTGRLRKYVTDRGKIIPSRITATCAKHQRQLTRAIKQARQMLILPHVVK